MLATSFWRELRSGRRPPSPRQLVGEAGAGRAGPAEEEVGSYLSCVRFGGVVAVALLLPPHPSQPTALLVACRLTYGRFGPQSP